MIFAIETPATLAARTLLILGRYLFALGAGTISWMEMKSGTSWVNSSVSGVSIGQRR